MIHHLRFLSLTFIACVMLSLASGIAKADEVPIITGEHWVRSSEELKKVYLVGVANVVQIEMAYHAENPPADAQSFVPRFSKGLKGQTLDSVREALNKWYLSNPERLQRPVLETIWFEMAVPGIKQNL